MILKTLAGSAIIFTSLTGQLNNATFDHVVDNNNALSSPVVLDKEEPGVFINFEMDDYDTANMIDNIRSGIYFGTNCSYITCTIFLFPKPICSI